MRQFQFSIRKVLVMRLNFALAASVLVLAAAVGATAAVAEDKRFIPIDIQPQGNGILTESWGSGRVGSTLANLPKGEQEFDKTKFHVGEKLIQLGSTRDVFSKKPDKVEGIKVDQKLDKLHILHAVQNGGYDPWFVYDNTLVGEYRVNFEDHSAIIIPIVYGVDVRDWFFSEGEKGPTHGAVAWVGDLDLATPSRLRIRLYKTTWENPWPAKKVTIIDYSGKKTETDAAPFCVAITAEQPVDDAELSERGKSTGR